MMHRQVFSLIMLLFVKKYTISRQLLFWIPYFCNHEVAAFNPPGRDKSLAFSLPGGLKAIYLVIMRALLVYTIRI